MESKVETKIQMVNILNRERIEINTVQEVVSSTDKEVIAKLQDSFIHITGTDLVIIKLIANKLSKKSFLGKVFK